MGNRKDTVEEKDKALALFETKEAKGKLALRLFSSSIFVGICLIWVYRLTNIPRVGERGRWIWIGMLMAELGFGFYWILTQAVRWNVVHYYPLKQRLSQSYDDKLPGVDIFICTADPTLEPPTMVINTILSVMSLNYPTEKLSVYLSDDGGSQLAFYALLEASRFSKHWIPFCKKFNVEPRAPEAYFTRNFDAHDTAIDAQEWLSIKKQYEDMKKRIEAVTNKGSVPEELKNQHKGFCEWNSNVTKQNHQPIVQIVIDGRDRSAVDSDGCRLPTLVYMAREKRPDCPHHFKAGAMNALIRVSSEISNGEIILNLDCDMYANNADSIREDLCFFMDEKRGHQIAFVQLPQKFNNITKNDLYGNFSTVLNKVELAGVGGFGAALYCGTGCFHRRVSLCGSKYSDESKGLLNLETRKSDERTVVELEEASKVLASCGYEKGTQWGKDMGLIYGCPVEDIVTGLTIHCRGWKSVFYNPDNTAFLGVAPPTLDIALVQFTRWSDGMFQTFLSKYCPFIYGYKKIKLGAQMGYSVYLLWAPISLPNLYYAIVLPLSLLQGIPLFPQVSSRWFIPFAYVFLSKNIYSIAEALICGSTLKTWWNLQRMLMIRRTTSFFFAFIDCIVRQLGLSQSTFTLTAKVVDEDVSKRYQQEIMDFGSTSIMFTVIATLAMLNLVSLVGVVKMFFWGLDYKDIEKLISQVILCGLIVLVNAPVYEALFFRKDKGSMPGNLLMNIGFLEFVAVILLAFLCNPSAVLGIRFVIDREECFSHNVKYDGGTIHVSFVVIKAYSTWHSSHEGVDLVVKGPSGDQIQDYRDKISEKFEFVAHQKGVHRFCFSNKSHYYETVDFDVHESYFTYYDQHAKDEHFNPFLEQISKLEEALYNIQFEQHWLEAQTERQAIVNEAMSKRAVHKAFYESAALIGASVLQVYLLWRLFERKLGMSRV
ncbi:cellulose synthase-like protein E6 [Durio zibethinus]|uniref:Cellulose synthase-like protein E6 n=1 Tax=Durio zibethinus TaxID=66656 RepID=A0A6P5WLS0_DURZI|nr:cellulose synthase-like protein E6 [Durio zibethinus]